MDEIIRSPEFLAYKFNFDTESVEFLPVSEDEIRRVPWLQHHAIDAQRKLISVPLNVVMQHLDSVSKPEHSARFVFHTAYCASTFVSQCLDVPGKTLVLREPQLLLDAANAKRLQYKTRSGVGYDQLITVFMTLLQKHAAPDQQLIIKPINSVNNILSELLARTGSTRSLLLYTDARNFLLSALKKGESARQTIRRMFDLLRMDFPHLANLNVSNVLQMSDLQIILTFWRLQLQQAEQILSKNAGNQTLASLYSEAVITQPESALIAINHHLGTGISDDEMAFIMKQDSRTKDAKNPEQRFSKQRRDAQYAEIERFYGDDLSNAYQWMMNNNPGTSITPSLSAGLDVT